MNTDFRVACGWTQHPKTLALIQGCGIEGALCLIRLWEYAALYRVTGEFVGLSDDHIERQIAGWNGEPGKLLAMLQQCGEQCGSKHGFLKRHPRGFLVLHGWREHNGYASGAAERVQIAKRAANARWRGTKGVTVGGDARAMQGAMHELHAPSPSPSPAPDPEERDSEVERRARVTRTAAGASLSPQARKQPDPDQIPKDEARRIFDRIRARARGGDPSA